MQDFERKRSATLAVIVRKGKLLLGRKPLAAKLGAGKLNGPGGGIEEWESPLRCLVREVREEFGIKLIAAMCQRLGLLMCYSHDGTYREVHIYYCDEFLGEPYKAEDMEPEWHAINELPWDEMHEADRYWLPLALRGERFNCLIEYEKPGEGLDRCQLLPYA